MAIAGRAIADLAFKWMPGLIAIAMNKAVNETIKTPRDPS
jgi:hypothetical protein